MESNSVRSYAVEFLVKLICELRRHRENCDSEERKKKEKNLQYFAKTRDVFRSNRREKNEGNLLYM